MTTRPRMAAAPRFGLVVGLAAGLAGCANVWGFDDLTAASPDDASPIATDGGDDVSEGSVQADAPDTDDSSDATLVDVQDAGRDGSGGLDGGDAGRSSDAASGADANDGAAMARCMGICTGCCDSQGTCQSGTAVSACGTGGKACLDCPVADKCTLPTTSSCCNSSACACATICGL